MQQKNRKIQVKQRARTMLRNILPTDPKTIWVKMMVLTCLLTSGIESKALPASSEKTNQTSTVIAPPANSVELSGESIDFFFQSEAAKQNMINYIVDQKTQYVQNQQIENISKMQNIMKHAKIQGNKDKLASDFLKDVSPIHLKKNINYCLAGAMDGYCRIEDQQLKPVIKKMIANVNSTPKDFNLFSHPNVSCPAFRIYYKQLLGANYFDRQSADFNERLNTLEKGDIIIIYSSENTSSNLHCVTFEKYDGDMLCVKSLNNEKDYKIKPVRVCCAAKFINQFRQNLSNELKYNNEFLASIIKSDPVLYKRVVEQTVQPIQKGKTILMPNSVNGLS